MSSNGKRFIDSDFFIIAKILSFDMLKNSGELQMSVSIYCHSVD
jgi:hypothetical protein